MQRRLSLNGLMCLKKTEVVVPAKAGIQGTFGTVAGAAEEQHYWIPAFAGMTGEVVSAWVFSAAETTGEASG